MITKKGRHEYHKWSGDWFGLTEGPWHIYRATDQQKFTVPAEETDATFADRIERSKKAGRNLFYEELPEFNPTPTMLW